MRNSKRMMMRGSVLLVGGMLALTACSSGGAGSATSNSSASATDAPAAVMSQSEWSKVVDAANKEGELTVYGLLNAKMVEQLPIAFQKEYPNIKLTYVRMAATDIQARLDAETAAGNPLADVVDNLDHPTFDGYVNKGALMPLTVPALGDSAFDRAQWQRTPYVATFANLAYAWAWNTKLLPQGINSWQDFLKLDPTQVGLTDPSIGPTAASLYQEVEKPDVAGPGFFDKLVSKGKPRLYPGSNPQITAMAAGEVSASLPVPVAVAASIKATGAPIDFKLYPNSASIPNEVAVVKAAKHPNAAQVYANWLLSAGGQKVVGDGGFISVREGTPQAVDVKGVTLVEIPQITPDQFKAFLVTWNQRFTK